MEFFSKRSDINRAILHIHGQDLERRRQLDPYLLKTYELMDEVLEQPGGREEVAEVHERIKQFKREEQEKANVLWGLGNER